MNVLVWVAVAAMFAVGAARKPAQPAPQPQPVQAQPKHASIVLGAVKTSSGKLSLVLTPTGIQYAVGSSQALLSEGELEARHPLLSELLKSAVATPSTPYLDARVDLDARMGGSDDSGATSGPDGSSSGF